MRERGISLCVCLIIFSCILTACGRNDAPMWVEEPVVEWEELAPEIEWEEPAPEIEWQEELDNVKGYTIEEARAISDLGQMELWIKRADGLFYPALTREVTAIHGSVVTFGSIGVSSDFHAEYPRLNLEAGEQLVTFSTRNDFFNVTEILRTGYAHYGVFFIGERDFHPKHNMRRTYANIETINGFDIAEEEFIERDDRVGRRRLELRGAGVGLIPSNARFEYHIVGDLGERILIGHFEGTQFVESEVFIEHKYYYWGYGSWGGAPGVRVPVEPTRDGYFVVNMEEIYSSGIYAIGGKCQQNFRVLEYIIDIGAIEQDVMIEEADEFYEEVVDTFIDDNGILWRVLDVDSEGNRLIITEYVYEIGVRYNPTRDFTLFEESNLKTEMDTWFRTYVGSDVKDMALNYEFRTDTNELIERNEVGAGIEFDWTGRGWPGGGGTGRTIYFAQDVLRGRTVAGTPASEGDRPAFALSISEANHYFNNSVDEDPNELRKATTPCGTSASWWLRSIGPDAGRSFMRVQGDGKITCTPSSGPGRSIGMRPALWISGQ